MDPTIVSRIALEVGLQEGTAAAVVGLFERGLAAPFIIRYRKEATGNLAPAKIRAVQERMSYYADLLERRAALVRLLLDQKKLTDELQQRIDRIFNKVELEDLFQVFRSKKRSRATEAVEKGLEPLAEYLWNQEPDAWSLEEHADVYIDPEKQVTSREQALQGSADIIAEWIADDIRVRQKLREMLWNEGVVVSTVVPAKAGLKTKYTMYYDRREKVAKIPSHRVLAIRRGTKEGILTSAIQGDSAAALEFLLTTVIKDKESAFAPILEKAARDSYHRILRPLIETEVRAMLKERADREAIRVFQENLRSLLMSPPAGQLVVMGIDAAKAEECHVVVVDGNGKLLEAGVISPLPPKNEVEAARALIKDLIARHGVQAIALGSNTLARDLESVIRTILAEEKIEGVLLVGVNDAGLAVYASSRTAREEFPEMSASGRSAVSLARRLQDPLSELVKIDPKLIGVGQYQHDVDQKELHRGLTQIVEACVNDVGVDLNAAGPFLLRYVAGFNDRLARKVVAHRDTHGPFTSRAALASVPGMESLSYQQAAGFVRVRSGENPLDRTAVHPETYPIVEWMATTLGCAVSELVGNAELVKSLKLEEFVQEGIGMATLEDIREELLHPGRDPRKPFAAPKFRPDVRQIGDLKEGMVLEGTVTNVTNFGAFVDIGIHQDGLVHLSQMSNRFIRDPRETVRVGDVVQVKIISIEEETKRIGLSMKALLPKTPRERKRTPRFRPKTAAPRERAAAPEGGQDAALAPRESRRRPGRRPPRRTRLEAPVPENAAAVAPAPEDPGETQPPPTEPEPSMQEKIALLQSKFRGTR
ncbi:MAG: RNA-binding transcriptional accessory protein [Acidobacteria bacterium]|nr:RNA-binding transcriptional accessory protein [Acidobacteriota bacterium]